MIDESYPWRCALIKDAEILNRWSKKIASERAAILFEKKIIISAFVIRKLIHSYKVCDHLTNGNIISIEKFNRKNITKEINFLNNHKVEQFYDFDKAYKNNISLEQFVNQIIHSYIFRFRHSDQGHFDSFLITSDKKKDDCIYKIELSHFIYLLKAVGHSGVCVMRWKNIAKDNVKIQCQELRCGLVNCFKNIQR